MNDAELRSRPTPDGLAPPLAALWWDAKGDWARAHEIAQALASQDGDWIHAYLHRKEGDLANADYWYRRARRHRPSASLESEWSELVAALSG